MSNEKPKIVFKKPVLSNKTSLVYSVITRVDDVFNMLFEIQVTCKKYHLQQFTKNGFEHLALGQIYEDLTDLLDRFTETHIGTHGRIDISFQTFEVENIENYIGTGLENLNQCRYFFSNWQLSKIDEISEVLAQGLYKLRFVTGQSKI